MNQKQWPTTIDEAVSVVIAMLPDEDRSSIAAMPESELMGMHFGLGMWIRNNLGLWQDHGALMQSVRNHNPGAQPDDVSTMIIENVWKRLRDMEPKVH